MKWSDFPVLASWLGKANGFVGTRGYAAPVGCELESLTAATTGAAVIFKRTTTAGRVQVKGSIMHDRQPRVGSDYIAEVMGKNPQVPIFQFTLSPKDQEDLDLSITCRLPTDCRGQITFWANFLSQLGHEWGGHIAKVLAALLVEDTPLVQETVDGLFVRSKADAEGEDSHAYRAVIRVWKYALDSNLSIRQTLRSPRQCTQRDLADTRTRLTRHTAETLTVSGGSMHQTSAAVTQLKEVVVNQVQLAIAGGDFKHNGSEKCIWVVVVPDATPLWKTSVSKADVFAHVWGEGVKAAGHMARWAMWWCLDGPDDAGCLLAIDDIGKLNEQVVALQRDTTMFIVGESRRFVVFPSGDGKSMALTNGGGKCWCCDDVTILVPLDHVLANVRWGSFLRTIKTDGRVGDVVHGACRVTNAFKKRLSDDIARWLFGVVGQRAMAREFHEIWADLLHEARSIPAAERKELLPRKAKEGTFDISTARLFWD